MAMDVVDDRTHGDDMRFVEVELDPGGAAVRLQGLPSPCPAWRGLAVALRTPGGQREKGRLPVLPGEAGDPR